MNVLQLSTGIVIDLNDGKVEGLTDTTRAGTTYHSFLALRYAEPPLGNLRYQVSFKCDLVRTPLSKYWVL